LFAKTLFKTTENLAVWMPEIARDYSTGYLAPRLLPQRSWQKIWWPPVSWTRSPTEK
jgi:ubiquinone biosynthesis protein Coq4